MDFYDDRFNDSEVRVAVLLQPVVSANGRAMAVVQVAETLELRRTLARRILIDTLWRQALLVAVIALVVVIVVQRATRPVRRLSSELQARPEGDLTPIAPGDAPSELLPLVDATNQVMRRLELLLDNQKRFVRDTAHQLRTPLAVLKVQVQSAARGDVEPRQAFGEIEDTVDRATTLANQMLALAKVEQLRLVPGCDRSDLGEAVRDDGARAVPADRRPRDRLRIETVPAPIAAHEWMLRELSRNLLHNAIRHTPPGARLDVRMAADPRSVALTIADSGPGIPADLLPRLFQPFSAADVRSGSGLGLAICQEIARALGGTITLENRENHGIVAGLDATVRLPLAENGASMEHSGWGRSGSKAAPSRKAEERMRLDKWLWCARFYKTRALAAEEIDRGRVELNGADVKRAHDVKVGDSLVLRREGVTRTVVVRGLSGQRGPAPVAQALYEETPESKATREAAAERGRYEREPAHTIEHGRPTKRGRRDIDEQSRQGWGDRWSASIDDE